MRSVGCAGFLTLWMIPTSRSLQNEAQPQTAAAVLDDAEFDRARDCGKRSHPERDRGDRQQNLNGGARRFEVALPGSEIAGGPIAEARMLLGGMRIAACPPCQPQRAGNRDCDKEQ